MYRGYRVGVGEGQALRLRLVAVDILVAALLVPLAYTVKRIATAPPSYDRVQVEALLERAIGIRNHLFVSERYRFRLAGKVSRRWVAGALRLWRLVAA
jgi:hypothetical protein